MAGSLSQLLGMINSLQLIVHLPLFAVSAPANVITIENILIPVVMFDILDVDILLQLTDKVLGTSLSNEEDDEVTSIPDQIQDLGYKVY
jgi:hypothetical protein